MALRLIDLEGRHYAAEATTSIDEELNSDSVLSITFQSTRTNEQFISDLSEMWKISGVKGKADDTQYVINFLSRKGVGDKMMAHVKAIPKMFDDLAKVREYQRYDQSFTAFNFFTLVFKDLPYTFALLDSFNALTFEGLGEGESKLEMFKRGIDRYGIEFEIVGNEVRMRKRIERDMPYQLRWRLNASNIQEEIDATGFFTFARGYGDYGDGEGGEDWRNAKLIREYTSPLAQIPNIGIRHAPPIKNGNITVESVMDENLKNLVDSSVKVTVTTEFLRLKNYPYAEPREGDVIHLIDERIKFKRKVRIIKVNTQRDANGFVTKQVITFGDVGIVKRHQSKINAAVKTVNELMDGRGKLPFNVLDSAVISATRALQSAQTELVFDNGIIAIEKTNPNELVLFNSKGLGISDDGGQTFKTAITGSGIVADVITAGTLRGIDIIGTNIISFNEATNGVITLVDGKIETFEAGDKTFEINRKGLSAFSATTGKEVATFRSSQISNQYYGADIRGQGDYLVLGRGDVDTSTMGQLGFLWYPTRTESAYLYGGSALKDTGRLELRSTHTGGTADTKIPKLWIDNYTDDEGVAWSSSILYVGRDNRNPTLSNFRSGFEIWQYRGTGDGQARFMLGVDTDPSGKTYANINTEKAYLPAETYISDGRGYYHNSLGVGIDAALTSLHGALDGNAVMYLDHWDIGNLGTERYIYGDYSFSGAENIFLVMAQPFGANAIYLNAAVYNQTSTGFRVYVGVSDKTDASREISNIGVRLFIIYEPRRS